MAKLPAPVSNGGNFFAAEVGDDLAPVGTFIAKFLKCHDEFGVIRAKFEQPAETETVDLTTFLFGFTDAAGVEHRVASKKMRISGHEKSALFALLKSMLGHAPQYGVDYATLAGTQCLLTVEHIEKRNGMGKFASIAAVSPVPAGFVRPAPVASGGEK